MSKQTAVDWLVEMDNKNPNWLKEEIKQAKSIEKPIVRDELNKLNQNKMKATLEFNLPEDQAEYDMVINATKFYSIIWAMKNELRSKVKYAQLSESEYKAYESMQDFFNELIHNEDVGNQF